MEGTWTLEVATPFGKHPATLIFERNNGALTARINSQIGDTHLSNINDRATGFDAIATHIFKEKSYQAKVEGQIEGDKINGTISVSLPFAPKVKFTGTRSDK